MCDFEEFIFTCGCSEQRLQSYCHYARNDPHHRCRRVRKLRSIWDQNVECERHMRERWMQWQWSQQQRQQNQGGQGQGGNH